MHYHKEDRELFIQHLADRFPKCFFADPSLRRPLKHNIIIDLENQNVLDNGKLSQTLDWYMSHFAYRHSLIAGTERINLDGKKAGTVTPQEQMEAKAWIATRKRELALRQQEIQQMATTTKSAPAKPVAKPHATVSNGSLHPSLSELRSAITIVNDLMTGEQYAPLRPVLAVAALREMINGVHKLGKSAT
jgi:sRNA-binding protein